MEATNGSVFMIPNYSGQITVLIFMHRISEIISITYSLKA